MSNTGAIITGEKDPKNLIQPQSISIPEPNESQILIKTVAYALNPTDWKHMYFVPNLKGSVAGTDASGIVEKVGSKVSGFQKGDYVSTFLHGNTKKDNGAFAKYIIGEPSMTVKFDKKFDDKELSVGNHESDVVKSFEGASSITLGLATVGMSFASNLKINPNKDENKDKYILIWGGSTATGIFAIQVAKKIYGLNVITTASSKNHKFLQSLGAFDVFDYKSEVALRELGKYDFHYVFDAVSTHESFQVCYEATSNSKHAKLDNLLGLNGDNIPFKREGDSNVEFVNPTLSYLAVGHDVDAYGHHWELTDEMFTKFKQFWFELLPSLIPELKTPNLRVLNKGFESVNEGLTLLKDGKVSAEKLVFRA